MTNFDSMTDEDWAKIREILAAGGKIYVHPKTAERMRKAAQETGLHDLLNVMVACSFVDEGVMLAAKTEGVGQSRSIDYEQAGAS